MSNSERSHWPAAYRYMSRMNACLSMLYPFSCCKRELTPPTSSRTTPPSNFSKTTVSAPSSPAAQAANKPPVPAPMMRISASSVSTTSASWISGSDPSQSLAELAADSVEAVSPWPVCSCGAHPDNPSAPPTPASATPAKNPRRENGVLPNDSISHPFLCYGSIQNGNQPSQARNQARCRCRTQRILRMKRIAFITLSG